MVESGRCAMTGECDASRRSSQAVPRSAWERSALAWCTRCRNRVRRRRTRRVERHRRTSRAERASRTSTAVYAHSKQYTPVDSVGRVLCTDVQVKLIDWAKFNVPPNTLYSVSQKKVAPPKTFCDIFTCDEPICNWKLLWLLPKHISMFTPILFHLSEYLCKLYHFY